MAAPLASGATFLRSDLQIHTPIDKRFTLPAGLSTSRKEDKQAIGQAYTEAALSKEISVLAITEHNDLTYFPFIREAATGTPLIIYPGVELTLPPGWHLIALFEPTADIETLWDFIVQMGLGRKLQDRFHSDQSPKQTNKSLPDALDLIAAFGGLAIAPHVCGNQGLLCLPQGQHRVECWKELRILAADPGSGKPVHSLGSFERGAFENTHDLYHRKHPIAPVWTSDARSFDQIGHHSTWLKLGAPTIEALRQAFLDPESRVRHPEDHQAVGYPRILDITWRGPGFLSEQALTFNPNLNCLVGGKGSGKSSVIESLRFAFDLPVPTHQKDAYQALIRNTIPPGSSVRVSFETSQPCLRYTIERSSGQPSRVYDASGALLTKTPPQAIQRLSLFGQKEIYETALKPPDQLALLDSFLGDALDPHNTAEADSLRDLARNAQELAEAEADDSALETKLRDLPRLQSMQKHYQELGVSKALERRSTFETNLMRLEAMRKRLAEFGVALGRSPDLTVPEAPSSTGEPLAKYLLETRETIREVARQWTTSLATVKKGVGEALSTVDQLKEAAGGEVQRETAAFEASRAKLEKQFPGTPIDEYLKLERKIAAIVPLSEERTKSAAKLQRLQKQRQKLLSTLETARLERFRLRQAKAAEINRRLAGILTINVAFQDSVSSLVAYLEGLRLGMRKSVFEQLAQDENFTPAFLVAIVSGDTDIATVAEIFSVSEQVSEKLLSALTPERCREIEVLESLDAIIIEFNVGTSESPQFRPLNQLSVGQKSTAILLLLLLKDDSPFIVDQPEDDLDNRFIYEDIVTRLRISKDRRQFIVATHNANIPVLGDAEQIVVLGASSNQGSVVEAGSIDKPQIQDQVKHILEGGTRAFELRRMKYGF